MKRFIHPLRNLASLLALSATMAFTSCQLDRSLLRNNEQPQQFARFDHAVEDYLVTGTFASWQKLTTDYPRETQTLVEDILHLGKMDEEHIGDTLRTFYSDTTLVKLRHDVERHFASLAPYEKDLTQAFHRLNEECPDFVTPHIYSQNSAFNQSIVVGDSLLGISLDKYLGADYPTYKKYFYENQRVTMIPQRIVQDCLTFYLAQQYILPQMKELPNPTLLDMMLHQGKIAWVVAQLTDRSLVDIAAVTPATKQWYTTHEKSVWSTLSHPDALASTDRAVVHSILMTSDAHPYFNDPHSRGVGLWLGMRIIDSYMKHNPKQTINSLLHDTDYRRILQHSHYPDAKTK